MAIHEWSPREKGIFLTQLYRLDNKQDDYNKKMKMNGLRKWIASTIKLRQLSSEVNSRLRVVEILKRTCSSKATYRSELERQEIRQYLIANLNCIPKTLVESEIDMLCNEVDYVPTLGRSMLFLQGDYGNVYYMIARGRVGLYVESEKEKERNIEMNYGHMRAMPYTGTDEELSGLGENVLTLHQGTGFGEYAILAATHKVRSCSAVTLDDDSFILVVNAETYNAVLRHHHFRQKQLQTSIAIIQELPLFKHLNVSSLTAVASTVKNVNFKKKELIVAERESIEYVLVIIAGDVKVCESQKVVHPNEVEGMSIMKKIVVSTLGKGKIIGQSELFKDMTHFEYTYEASVLTETMVIPVTAFLEAMKSIHFKRTFSKSSNGSSHGGGGGGRREKKDRLLLSSDRAESAFDLIKNLIQLKSNNELVITLPTIGNNGPGKHSSSNRLTKAILHSKLESTVEATRSVHEEDSGRLGGIKHESSSGKHESTSERIPSSRSVLSTTHSAKKPSTAAPSMPSSSTTTTSGHRRSFITRGGRKLSFLNSASADSNHD